MKLSKRLQAIYDLVDQDAIIADVGCDHALLPCALVLNKRIQKAYACDIAQEPLKQAEKSIQYYKLEESIQTILSDGLKQVPSDTDTIVIAGMGFETIKLILDESRDKLNHINKIIVQSNRDVEKLRNYISEHNYHIVEEICILDHHYYQIVVFDCSHAEKLSEQEVFFGKEMRKDNVFHQMWYANLRKYETILNNLDEENEKYPIMKSIIKRIKDEIES